MKLYTEEQMKEAIKIALHGFGIGGIEDTIEVVASKFTPIQLPSDEEIGKLRDEHIPIDEENMWSERFYFTIGAKAMRDKIQGGNK